ncbi:hypothetical protein [Pseudomonas sichuanensis]|uniref:hypothetical protein n=1 Tax=Pseudomonas sichuanensis TaxID=2213015 RepID=UPI002B40B706|nr:hypothetical protein [Pseudomonas sichuanensis]
MAIDLDYDPGAPVEGGIALTADPAGFFVRIFERARFELVHIETIAVDVPAMDHSDKAALWLLVPLLSLLDQLFRHQHAVADVGHHRGPL